MIEVGRSAVLTARRDAGAGLNLITLTPPPALAHTYRAPGQYIEVRAQSSGYFVLAGEIDAPSWELLVRNSGGAADALSNAPEGTSFDILGPLGNGFPLDRAEGRALVVAVVGSALAVARPILRQRIAQGESKATTIYIGARSAKDVPLIREVAGWARAGARLVLCLSGADDDPELLPEAVRAKGWVQNVLQDDVSAGRITDALVFATGPTEMLHAVRGLAESREKAGPLLEVITNV
jgi:NAD(P)H-flavin reductase